MELVSKHQNKKQVVRLRGKWVEIDPRQWHKRFDMTVTVGLGTGSQQAVLQGAMGIMQIQQGMLTMGLGGRTVNESNIYHAARRYSKAVFPRDADLFFQDPQSVPPPQPKPDPEILKLQLAAHKAEMSDAQKRDKTAIDAQLEQMRMGVEAEKVQFQEMMKRVSEDKSHNVEMAKEVMKMANENRQTVLDKLSEIQKGSMEINGEKQAMLLQGQIDALLEQQKQLHEQVMQAKELAMQEKEIVRDAKGKATGVRPKTKKTN